MKTIDVVLIPKSLAESMWRNAIDACTFLADTQPHPRSEAARLLARLDRAVRAYERERTWTRVVGGAKRRVESGAATVKRKT